MTTGNADKSDRIERIRTGLLSSIVDRKKKLALLKELVRYRSDARVPQVLREAAAAPANDNMLGYIVRSFGYLSGPQTMADLAPYFQHRVRSVVSNAVKAAAAIDRGEAVRLALPVVRSGNPDTAIAAARVLAERCRGECHAQFLEMAFAPLATDRYAAVLYLRWVPPDDGLPLLAEMMRREREPELVAMIARVLPKVALKADALAKLREELIAKVTELDAAVADAAARGPEAVDAEDATDEDAARETMDKLPLDAVAVARAGGTRKIAQATEESAFSSLGLGEPPAQHVSASIPVPVPAAPAPAAPEPVPPEPAGEAPSPAPEVEARVGPPSSPERKPARPTPNARQPVPALSTLDERAAEPPPEHKRSTGRSPVAAADTLPWQKKEEQQKRRRQQIKNITQAFRIDQLNDYARRKPMAVGLALVLLGYALFLTVGRSDATKAPKPRVNDIVEGALGRVGAKITFSGTLIEVNRDYNILLVRDERQMVVSAYYSDQSVSHFIKGKRVTLQGTIREIKSERAFVVQGITASQT